jgi:hypothetical protein
VSKTAFATILGTFRSQVMQRGDCNVPSVKINSIFWYVLLDSAVIAGIVIIFECFGILIRASGDDTPGGRVG